MINYKRQTVSCYTSNEMKNWVQEEAKDKSISVSKYLWEMLMERKILAKPIKKGKVNKKKKTKVIIRKKTTKANTKAKAKTTKTKTTKTKTTKTKRTKK